MHELVRHRDPHFSLAICGLYHPDSHGDLAYEFDRVRDYVYGSYLCYTSEVEERSESLSKFHIKYLFHYRRANDMLVQR